MRILRLDLDRFGTFRNVKLKLARAGDLSRLTIVRGANEAGKTTTLDAIRCLLFGFPDRASHFAVGFDQSELAVGALVEFAGGKRVEILRTKGRGPTLHGKMADVEGDEIDEEWFQVKLARPNRPLFENVFGFSLDKLSQGAEALERDEIESALYGAGFGANLRPQKILEEMQSERDKLFTERGRSQRVPDAMRQIEALRKSTNEATTSADEWRRMSEMRAQKEAEFDRARTAAGRARREHQRVRAVLDGLEPWRERRAAQDDLATLDVPAALTAERVRAHARSIGERERSMREAEESRAMVRQYEAALAETSVDRALLDVELEIESLTRGLDAQRARALERPVRAARLEETSRRIVAELANVRPDWDLDRLRATRFDTAALADFRAAIERHELLARDTRRAEDEISTLETSIRAQDARLHSMGPEDDDATTAPLVRWLANASGYDAERERHAATRRDLALVDRRRTALRRRLDPPLSDASCDLSSLPVSRTEEVDRFVFEWDAATRAVQAIEARVAEAEAEIVQAKERVVELESTLEAPSEEDLREARARRDRGWKLVARALQREPIDGEVHAFDESLPLPRAYERAVSTADRIVDGMRANASLVERRAALARRTSDLSAHRRRREESAAAFEDLRARWIDAWRRCGFEPLAPAAMRAWLADRDAALDLDEQSNELRATHDRLTERLDRHLDEGRAAIGDATSPVETIRMRAEERVQRAARIREEKSNVRASLDRDRTSLDDARARLSRLRDEASRWLDAWSTAVKRLGVLDDPWKSPTGAESAPSVAATRAVVDELVRLRSMIEAADDERRILDALDADLDAWTRRVDHARDSCGIAIATKDAPSIVERLGANLRAAREAERVQSERRAALDRERARLGEKERALEEANRALAALREDVGAADDEAFFAFAARCDHAAGLRAKIEESTRALRLVRGDMDEREHLASLRDADPLQLRLDLDRFAAEADAREREAYALQSEVGQLIERLAKVDGTGTAAERASEAAGIRARLRTDVERWAMLTVAEHLLTAGVHRFENEHQPEILRVAATLFREMTAGRWVGIKRRLDRAIYVERDDGSLLPPNALSTGTREQLFLAIRLAYVEHYGRRAEPLPIVLDDVLVNFDPSRTTATLRALSSFAVRTQVLLFTCHDHLVDRAREANLDVVVTSFSDVDGAV